MTSEFNFGYLCARLEKNADWQFDDFIYELNSNLEDLNMTNISTKNLEQLCELYCGDVEIIKYKDKKVVVVGEDHINGVVYYCKIDKSVKLLDSEDEEAIEEMRNEEIRNEEEDLEEYVCYTCENPKFRYDILDPEGKRTLKIWGKEQFCSCR